MQEFYSHCVPKDNLSKDDECKDHKSEHSRIRRMCVVLRTGQQKEFERDTGEACTDLAPRKAISYYHGPIANLKVGSSYTRRELQKMNAHQVIIASNSFYSRLVEPNNLERSL